MMARTLAELDGNDLGRLVTLGDVQGELRRIEHIATDERRITHLVVRSTSMQVFSLPSETRCFIDGRPQGWEPT